MTLLEKIKNITWWTLDIKLKDILTELFATTEGIDTRVTNIENTSSVDSRPYKVYTALLTQLDTDAPVPSILENTLGDITFSRISIGTYRIESTGLFTLNKTIYFINVPEQVLGDNMGVKNTQLQNINQLNFVTYISSSDQIADNVLIPTSFIEIRVYN